MLDIHEDETEITLLMDTIEIPEYVKKYNTFKFQDEYKLVFDKYTETVNNKDAVSIMMSVQKLLKNQKGSQIMHPFEYYEELTSYLLDVGTPYSTFIEMLFANMFVCDDEFTEFWRYDISKSIVYKIGQKSLADKLSPQLGCLFHPNKKTIKDIDSFGNKNINDLTIYERIFLEQI